MVRTQLGRRVAHDDTFGFHRDRLLDVLYQMRETKGDEARLSSGEIASVTGLPAQEVSALVSVLISLDMLAPHAPSNTLNTFGISDRGVRWVEESPTPPVFD
jgi:hypothetical protein